MMGQGQSWRLSAQKWETGSLGRKQCEGRRGGKKIVIHTANNLLNNKQTTPPPPVSKVKRTLVNNFGVERTSKLKLKTILRTLHSKTNSMQKVILKIKHIALEMHFKNMKD